MFSVLHEAHYAQFDVQKTLSPAPRWACRAHHADKISSSRLCTTSQTNYISEVPEGFTTSRPQNLDEETMTPVDETVPNYAPAGLYVFDYATLLLRFHRAMAEAGAEDDHTRYAIVLKFDGELRTMAADKAPICFKPQFSSGPNVPKWVSWARRMHEASITHKFIMLHQSFLTKSLKNARYTYSRWACITASKKIIDAYTTRDPEEPQWWIEQAFLITAGICLMLDLFHRPEKEDKEALEYVARVQKAISFLQQFFTSSIATHGVRLLLSLHQDFTKLLEGSRPPGRLVSQTARVLPITTTTADLHIADAGKTSRPTPYSLDPELLVSNEQAAQFSFDIDSLGYEDLMDYIPVDGGMDNTVYFDSINGLPVTSQW